MGSSNRSKTSYVQEVTAGTTPASPAFKEMRVTSNTMQLQPTRTTSNEIRADRQVVDQILVDLNTNGETGIELSFHAHDDLIEAALQGTWSNKASITVATQDTEISDLTSTTFTVSAGGTNFKAGDLVLSTGFPTSANNDIIRAVASSTSTTVVMGASSYTAETDPIPVDATIRVVGVEGGSGDIEAVTAGGNALTSTLLDFTTLDINVGEWIKIGGDATGTKFTTSANNSWALVSAVAANRLSLDVVPSGWTADDGSGKTLQIFFGDYVRNGTTQRSFTIERQQQDLASPAYEYFTGSQIDTMSMSFKSASIITGSFGWLGLSGSASTTRAASATDTDAPQYAVLNASSNVGRLAIGGTLVAAPSYLTEIGINLKNNLSRQTAVSVLGATGISDYELEVTGNFNAYFGDLAYLSAVLDDTESSIMLRTGRADGNRESLVMHVAKVKLTGSAPVSGKNQDRMFSGTYAAKLDTTFGTISAGRFWYLPASA